MNIDSFVNLISLILQFSFSTKIYFKLCVKCDKKMNSWFNKRGNQRNLHDLQMNNTSSNGDDAYDIGDHDQVEDKALEKR